MGDVGLLDAVVAARAAVGTAADDEARRLAEFALLEARHAAGESAIAEPAPRRPIPEPDPVAGAEIPAVLQAADLSPATLGAGLAASGCVHVRGLLDQATIEELLGGIDRVFDAHDRWVETGEATAWFTPFPDVQEIKTARPWLRKGGGVSTAESPRLCARWFELVEEVGLLDLVTTYFDERPVTSLTKCCLRRVPAGGGIEWHQDGAFLGPESGAVNVWVSLSDTDGAPGLELVSRRFDHVVETGTQGATFDWSVGEGVIADLAVEAPVVRPHFQPGDALIFDGLLLHRTSQDVPPKPGSRYAIETWFFRPSRFPAHEKAPLAY